MAELTKQQLGVENTQSFPNNTTGYITPTLLRTFNGNIIDSMVDEITYNADSASWENDIEALKAFSASLDVQFVTPTELSASASTLQNDINTKLNTSSFNAYTASQVTINTGSFLTTSSFNQYTQSASTNVTASINAATQSLSASLTLTDNTKLNTSSFNTFTQSYQADSASFNSRINSVTGSTPAGTISSSAQIAGFGYATTSSVSQSVSALNAATSSYITNSQTASMSVLSASFAVSSSRSVSSSFATNATSASYSITSSRAANVVITARNGNASTLGAGTVVRISGASGDNPIFNTASFVDEADSSNTLGLLANSIASGADGDVVVLGTVLGVNTDPALGYVAGQIIYLSASGQFTNVQPQAPQNIVTLGEVLRAQQNNGSIFVNISNGWELNELHNVRITNPQNGQTLVYSSSLWINSSSAATVNTGSLLTTASISGDTITFTKGDGSTFPIVVPTGSGGSGSVPAGTVSSSQQIAEFGYATTGSNTFNGSQAIVVPSGPIIAGTANSDNLQIDTYVNAGNYDTFNILVSESNGVQLRDYSVTLNQVNPFISVDTDGGLLHFHRNISAPNNDPNGLAVHVVTGSVEITSPQGTGHFYSNLPITSSNGRINGYFIAKNIIVSGSGTGTPADTSGSAWIEGWVRANQVTASLVSASTYIGLPSGLVSGASQVLNGSGVYSSSAQLPNGLLSSSAQALSGTGVYSSSAQLPAGLVSSSAQIGGFGYATTGSNNFVGNQTISGSTALTGSAPTQLWVSGGLTLSGSLLTNATDIYTGSNNANFVVTLGSASMASLLAGGTTNPNTLYFVLS